MSDEEMWAFAIKVQNEANLFLRLEKVPTRIMCASAVQGSLRRRRAANPTGNFVDIALQAYPNSEVSSYADAVAVLKKKVNEGSFVVTDKDGNPLKGDQYEEADENSFPTKKTTPSSTATTTPTTTITTAAFGKVECIAENGAGKWLLGIAAGSNCNSQLATLNEILDECPKDHGTLKCDSVTNGVDTYQVLSDFGGLNSCKKTAAALSTMLAEFTGPVRPLEPAITCASFRHLQVAAAKREECEVFADAYNDAFEGYQEGDFIGCDMTTATTTATTTLTTTSTKSTTTTTLTVTTTTATTTTTTVPTTTTYTGTTKTTTTKTTITTVTSTTVTSTTVTATTGTTTTTVSTVTTTSATGTTVSSTTVTTTTPKPAPTLPNALTNPGGTTTKAAATNPGDTTTAVDPAAPTTTSTGNCLGKLLGSVVFNVVGAFLLTASQLNEMGENAKDEAARLVLGANIPTGIVCQRSLFGGNRGLPDGLVVELVANTFSSDQANDKASELVDTTIRNKLFNIPVAGSPWPLVAENFVYEGQPFITTLTTTTVNITTVDPNVAAAEQTARDEAAARSSRTTLIIACVSVAAVLCFLFVGIVMMEKKASEGTQLDLYSTGAQGGNGMLVNPMQGNYGKPNDLGDFGGVSNFLLGMGENPDAMSMGYVDVRPEFRPGSATHFFPPGGSGFDTGPNVLGLAGPGGGGGGGGSHYRQPGGNNGGGSQFSQYRVPQGRNPGGAGPGGMMQNSLAMNRSEHYFPATDFTGGMFAGGGNMTAVSPTFSSPGENLRTPPGLSPGGGGMTWGAVPEPFIMGNVAQANAASNNGAWSQTVQPENEWTVLGGNRNAAFNSFM